jgi:uncharacterized protein (DUF433 family)
MSVTFLQSRLFQHAVLHSRREAKRGGKPCIRGSAVTVHDILDDLASGMSEDEIPSEFPDLRRDDIRATLAFAADRERRFSGMAAERSCAPPNVF